MTLDDLSTAGHVVYIDPQCLEDHGFPRDIRGVHPFVILASDSRRGMTYSLVVPLTTKGSRWSAKRIPCEYLLGTETFRTRPNFIYSRWYAQWYPTWALLEACAPSPSVRHCGNRLCAEGIRFVLGHVAVPNLGDSAA